jgi:hypothetical protein
MLGIWDFKDSVNGYSFFFDQTGIIAMCIFYRALMISSLACLLIAGFFSPALAKEGYTDLKFQGKTLSADVKKVPLKAILEKLKKEKGIWFEGDESLFEEKVSVQFKDLPLLDGVKRILAHLNYSLMFDKNQRLVGVIVLGRLDPSRMNVGSRREPAKGTNPQEASIDISPDSGMFKVVPNSPPPGNPNPKPIDMTIIKNLPPPENPNVKPLDTTVIKNLPPPGNPDAEPIDMTIIKNAPPPGD